MTKEVLEKTLGYKSILLITINSIMGTGIFFLPAIGAQMSGPASLVSWFIMSVIAVYTAVCFAELTSMFPQSGGIYEFAKQVYGRTLSFFIGWMTLIVGYITIAMLIIGAISYLLPNGANKWMILFFAALIIILFNYVTYKGMKTSSTMLIAFAFITLATLLSLIIPGLFTIELGYVQPFFVTEWAAIFVTVFLVAETFFGWETATFLAGETKNGAKVVPKALIVSTIIIVIIALLFVFISLTTIPWNIFGDSDAPLTDLATALYGDGATSIFSMLVYLSIIGSVAGWIVSAPRLILSLSQDRLFIKQLAHISPKYKTPSLAILFQTILIIFFLLVGAGSYEKLLHLLVPLVLFLYGAIMLTVVILRYKMPTKKRYVRAPFGKIGPFVLIAIYTSMIFVWAINEDHAFELLELAFLFMLVGVPIYGLVEIYNDPVVSRKLKDFTAYFTYFFEGLFMPKKVKDKIITYLGDINGKTVLEYGSSVGTLTSDLLINVGKYGHVISINNSHTELKILERRIKEPSWKSLDRLEGDLQIILHPEYHTHIHSSISKVDAIVSIDTISNLSDPTNILRELADTIPIGAKVCFFDFSDFFSLVPNQYWLHSKQKIMNIFLESGFEITVEKENHLFWKYIYIYGKRIKSKN